MTWRGRLVRVTTILTVTAILIACGGGPAKIKSQLGSYPSSPALDATLRTHADAPADREERLVLATWFLNGDPRVALYTSIRPDGHVTLYRYMHEAGALQNSRSLQLVPDQMTALQQAIDQMPASQRPALANLLIVSFRRDGAWLTRTYDRTSRPAAVETLFALTGAPIVPEGQQMAQP